MEQESAIERLIEALGHPFEERALLLQALTHRSYAHENPKVAVDNERMEFLGDAILGWVTSLWLYRRDPHANEGTLTKQRAALVSQSSLARVAKKLGFADAMRLGAGEARSGGRSKPRLLASAFEACVAAVYLDGGADAVMAMVTRLFEDELRLHGLPSTDEKSNLQERVQAKKQAPPVYKLVRTEGPDHDRRFVVAVVLADGAQFEGEGRSKAEAEQAAAHAALDTLGKKTQAQA